MQITKLVKHIAKYTATVTNPQEIRYHLEKAVYFATTRRKGSIWVDIPLDTQANEIIPEKLNCFSPDSQKWVVSKNIITRIKDYFECFKISLILYGHGVWASNAQQETCRLVEITKIPFLLNWHAKGILSEQHPLFLGFPGIPVPRYSNFILQNADFLLVVGSRLNYAITAHNAKNFSRHAVKVVVDIDENELKLLDQNVEIKLHCDAKVFLWELIQEISTGEELPDYTKWTAFCNRLKKEYVSYNERP